MRTIVTDFNPHFQDLGTAVARSLGESGVSFRRGTADFTWPSGLLPVVLTREEYAAIRVTGQAVAALLEPSYNLLRESKEVRRRIFSTTKAEGQFWVEDQPYPLSREPLFRVDMLQGSKGLNLLDVNLMPGMSGITGKYTSIYAEYMGDTVATAGVRLLPFHTDKWVAATSAQFSEPAFTYVVRRNHALVPDIKLLVEACNRGSTKACVAYLDDFRSGLNGRRAIVRQFRQYSKHQSSTTALASAEQDGFARLTDAMLKNQLQASPRLCMYLESHAWIALWQTQFFRDFLTDPKQIHSLEELLGHLPKTSFASDTNKHFNASSQNLLRKVIKRSDSTGGDGLIDPRRFATNEALRQMHGALTSDQSEALLVQDIVDSPSLPMPYSDHSDTIAYISAAPKLAAYFVGENLVGIHCLLHRQRSASNLRWPSPINLPLLCAVALEDV